METPLHIYPSAHLHIHARLLPRLHCIAVQHSTVQSGTGQDCNQIPYCVYLNRAISHSLCYRDKNAMTRFIVQLSMIGFSHPHPPPPPPPLPRPLPRPPPHPKLRNPENGTPGTRRSHDPITALSGLQTECHSCQAGRRGGYDEMSAFFPTWRKSGSTPLCWQLGKRGKENLTSAYDGIGRVSTEQDGNRSPSTCERIPKHFCVMHHMHAREILSLFNFSSSFVHFAAPFSYATFHLNPRKM